MILPDVPQTDPAMFSFLLAIRTALVTPAASTTTWDTLSGKPTSFAPSAHAHVYSDISNFGLGVNSSLTQGTGIALSYAAGVTTIAGSFLQGGTGGVTRVGQDKQREVVSVTDYKGVSNTWTDAFGKAATYAGSLSATGVGEVHVPAGDYTGLGTVSTAAFWIIDAGASFPSQSSNGASGTWPLKVYPLAGYIIETVKASGIYRRTMRNGTTYTEVSTRPYSISIASFGVESSEGNPAVTGASHSLNSPSGGMGTIGVSGFGTNNNSSVINGSWGGYFESRRQSGALGTAIGVEIDNVNYGGVVNIYPWGGDGSGFTAALWLSSGGGFGGANAISCAIGILNNTSTFRRGIVFLDGALVSGLGVDSNKEAIAFPVNHQITWYSGTTAGAAHIEANVASGARTALTLKSNNNDGYGLGIEINREHNCVTPTLDNAIVLGSGSLSWFNVNSYGYTTTSDARAKVQLGELDHRVLAAVAAVEIVQFRWNESRDQRIQVGVIAQQLVAAFSYYGLDALDYGVVSRTDDRYTVNYDTLSMMMIASLRKR